MVTPLIPSGEVDAACSPLRSPCGASRGWDLWRSASSQSSFARAAYRGRGLCRGDSPPCVVVLILLVGWSVRSALVALLATSSSTIERPQLATTVRDR